MKRMSLIAISFTALAAVAGGYAFGAGTQPTLVQTYNDLADSILATHRAERSIVGAILHAHLGAARAAAASGKWDEAAAELALVANEGDNAVGGIRKRLLEGGHHANSEGEAKGIFEPGYVLITVEAKKALLGMVARLQGAADDAARKAVWAEIEKAAATYCPTK